MNCQYIWYNLPKEIKDNLNINLLYNWNRLPIEINSYLRDKELNSNELYLQYFAPNYKTNWFYLLRDLNLICQMLEA